MGNIFIINTHSFVDIITNSSTELFICGDNKSVDTIKELIEQYCPMIGDCYEVRLPNKEELFWGRYSNRILEERYGSYSWEKNIYLPNELLDEAKGCGIWIRDDIKQKEGYFCCGGPSWGYEKNINSNTVLVEGSGDNEIPYEYFDLLENILDAQRYHLG